VININGSGTENFVSIISDGAPGNLYIYKFLYLDEILQQQSFSHWNFATNVKVLAAASIGSYMYLMLDRPEGIMLERIEFTQNTIDISMEPYRTYMDQKKLIQIGAYDADLNVSKVTIESILGGLPASDSVFYTIDAQGVTLRHEGPWPSGATLEFGGDRAGEYVVFGREYEFVYEFSKFLIKQTADDGSTSTEDIGRLQLRRAWLNYEYSGAFEVNVDNGSTQYVYAMAGGRLGNQTRLGELSLGTGQYKFPVTGNAQAQRVTISSSNPNPLNIIGCGWEGNYIRRSGGI
jgi:hypothetical protein